MTLVAQARPEQAAVQHSHWPRRLPRQLEIPRTSLWFNLEVAARRFPDKPALHYVGATLSYAQLHEQALRLAAWLQSRGVQAGDRVALFMQNCPQFVVAFYAVNRANAVVVPVNPMNREDEFGHYISDPETRVVICSAELAPVVGRSGASPTQNGAASLRFMPSRASESSLIFFCSGVSFGLSSCMILSRRSFSSCGSFSA